MNRFLNALRFYPTSVALRWEIAAARRVLNGKYARHALEALGIPGFGTSLFRIDFPPNITAKQPAAGVRPPLAALTAMFEAELPQYIGLFENFLGYIREYRNWPATFDGERPSFPWQENEFLTPFDQLSLYGMLRTRQPSRYVEIGSGMSTRIANRARADGNFQMEVMSIDPKPRVDVESLCDYVVRERLETAADRLLGAVIPGSIVFVDGSHRCFPGSDVTVFFLEIMPLLPKGTLVHFHDIFLPYDYPPNAYQRLWSEQYLLAAYLLGGSRDYAVILPCAFLTAQSAVTARIAADLDSVSTSGSSFWLQKVS